MEVKKQNIKRTLYAILIYKETLEKYAKRWRDDHRKLFRHTNNPFYDEQMKSEIALVVKWMARLRNETLMQAADSARRAATPELAALKIESLISDDGIAEEVTENE